MSCKGIRRNISVASPSSSPLEAITQEVKKKNTLEHSIGKLLRTEKLLWGVFSIEIGSDHRKTPINKSFILFLEGFLNSPVWCKSVIYHRHQMKAQLVIK